MAWIQCLVWIAVIFACPHWHHHGITRHDSYAQQYQNYDSFQWGSQHHIERLTKSPNQRVIERSISRTTSFQRVQEDTRRRYEPKTDDRGNRNDNGSFRVINDYYRPYPTVDNRRGEEERIPIQITQRIAFPEPTESDFTPVIPEECEKTGFCESVPNYPETHVDKLIQQVGDANDKFRVDELLPPDLSNRFGLSEETELCKYKEKIVAPQAAPDRDGKWHFIVNKKDKPLQGFRVEICTGDFSCNQEVATYFSNAKCVQKRMLRYMTAIDKNGVMIDKPFAIPSCCSCVVEIFPNK